MNELGTDKNSLKIWRHNSKKQKSYGILENEKQILFFLASQWLFRNEVADHRELPAVTKCFQQTERVLC